MDDAFFVRGFERFHDVARNIQSFVERQRPAQILAFHQFHHDRVLFQTIDGRNVGMIQGCQHLRFAPEARHVVGVVCERRGEYFDGEIAAELRIVRAVHFAHAAST